jgi:hypothetical protein
MREDGESSSEWVGIVRTFNGDGVAAASRVISFQQLIASLRDAAATGAWGVAIGPRRKIRCRLADHVVHLYAVTMQLRIVAVMYGAVTGASTEIATYGDAAHPSITIVQSGARNHWRAAPLGFDTAAVLALPREQLSAALDEAIGTGNHDQPREDDEEFEEDVDADSDADADADRDGDDQHPDVDSFDQVMENVEIDLAQLN